MHNSMLVSLEQVIEQKLLFNVPIYQRLYVWGPEQIKTLLDDLVAACKAGKDVFYLGGTLVIEQENTGFIDPVLDLIDGQQRFTTLWLLSIALERLIKQRQSQEVNHLSEYRMVEMNDSHQPRIRFAIRPEVSRFFDALLHGETLPDNTHADVLSHAISEMEGYFGKHTELCLTDISHFIRHRVQLVLTRVPVNTDLNKLFEVINNRGAQLQHHDILKARLLELIEDDQQREIHAQLWDACAYMNDYVEKNLASATGVKLAPWYRQDDDTADPLATAGCVRGALQSLSSGHQNRVFTLADILEGNVAVDPASVNKYEQTTQVRSIISFPVLLQHVLRIFLHQQHQTDIEHILDKELLTIFDEHWLAMHKPGGSEVMAFIGLLWQCRYLFDKHVIKWVDDNGEDRLVIRPLRLNENSLVRDQSNANSSLSMLQSMLYHSQQLTTQYWLTPLLNYLLQFGGQEVLTYLKYLDNRLLCTSTGQSLMDRTRHFLKEPWFDGHSLMDMEGALSASHGTGFWHYWFYKLEYILWDRYREEKGSAWQAFRMTAKNSVEHVSPQQPEGCDSNVLQKLVDNFGNLALVSRGINSEYGNKPYVEKRARFRERNAARADSLKLWLIYEHESWNDDFALEHQNRMIKEYAYYFEQVEHAALKVRT
ncbi:DUF262 domain-containing protein [uncultured Oceanisphaera sp.]|uniref:DUF262 domain-containing protein n=1 Tax=uncultured Oceanisphaera sp. TaxID=353858 RepID=UPI002622D64A|nr:DUF262 domain-containing HNH endonuclease family protein [uncultured Oceanisphaera sp.]